MFDIFCEFIINATSITFRINLLAEGEETFPLEFKKEDILGKILI